MSAAGSPDVKPARALPSAAFLACSWTWCVGMWLPVYLIHDFGAWAWVAFAAPNVIGAAAVGFIHRNAASVDRFTQRGLEPMRWFSVVTILFHLGFLGWITHEHAPPFIPDSAAYAVAPAALLIAGALSVFGSRVFRALSLAIVTPYVLALVIFPIIAIVIGVVMYGAPNGPFIPWLAPPPIDGTVTDPTALPLYAVGLAFGFLLCPHLDLSILRARRETPGAGGDAAFLLGFGCFFLMMIAFTAFYAGGFLLGWFSHYLLLHFFIQGTFTVGAHLRELREHRWPRALGPKPVLVFLILAIACVALVPISDLARLLPSKPNTRFAYETFIWFYALPFPAAAWFLLRRRRLGRAFWASLALATPAMTAGALLGVWWCVPLGALIPLAACFIAPKQP